MPKGKFTRERRTTLSICFVDLPRDRAIPEKKRNKDNFAKNMTDRIERDKACSNRPKNVTKLVSKKPQLGGTCEQKKNYERLLRSYGLKWKWNSGT